MSKSVRIILIETLDSVKYLPVPEDALNKPFGDVDEACKIFNSLTNDVYKGMDMRRNKGGETCWLCAPDVSVRLVDKM